MIMIKFIGTGVLVLGLLFIKSLLKLNVVKRQVETERNAQTVSRIDNPGSVKELRLLPLVDYYTDDDTYKTEAGVSYYISADDCNILLDLGANARKEHPSPLIHNMTQLGKSPDSLDYIFISHAHLDHIGGMKEQKRQQFSLSAGAVDVPKIPVFSPVPLSPSRFNPQPEVTVITEPYAIQDGIYSIGAIPRALYLMGRTLENALAFNVEGKGIVLVIGCGHQSIDKIIERSTVLFDRPIYGIIGGLHLPAGGGRIKIGPVDIQPIMGTDRPPWNSLNHQDTELAIEAIKAVNPSFVALSPHDSSDETLARFRKAFGSVYHELKVGNELVL